MDWFRFYDEVLDDPKVQRLPDNLFRGWINLLCLANRGATRGMLPDCMEDLAFALRTSTENAASIIEQLTARGLIERVDGGHTPHNWNKRQYKSDDSNARSTLHRQRKQGVDTDDNATLHATPDATLQATPPETEQNRTETEIPAPATPDNSTSTDAVATRQQPKKKPALTTQASITAFNAFWAIYPKRDGYKGDKQQTQAIYAKLAPEEWPEVQRALERYVKLCDPGRPDPRPSRDAERFLKDDFWRSMLDADEPAGAQPPTTGPTVEQTRQMLDTEYGVRRTTVYSRAGPKTAA